MFEEQGSSLHGVGLSFSVRCFLKSQKKIKKTIQERVKEIFKYTIES